MIDLLVIGVGNPHREDDGAGIEVARRLKECLAGLPVTSCRGDATEIAESLRTARHVILVDAWNSPGEAGEIRWWEGGTEVLPNSKASSHGMGVAEALGLAEALGWLPERLELVAIRGRRFGPGVGLDGAVEKAVGEVVEILKARLGGKHA